MELDDGNVFYDVLSWYLNKVGIKTLFPSEDGCVKPFPAFLLMPTDPWAPPIPERQSYAVYDL